MFLASLEDGHLFHEQMTRFMELSLGKTSQPVKFGSQSHVDDQ